MSDAAETILPTDQEARIARELSVLLASSGFGDAPTHLHLTGSNNQEAELTLPISVINALLGILKEMGKGNGVTITPVQKEFTTQQAADFLLVSRPYLIEELLEKGALPYRKVGNRRRIRAEDLLRYKESEQQEIARRETVMRELISETERLGLYK